MQARKIAIMKMHEGQVDVDEDLVARLLAAQYPKLDEMPIMRVASTGTVNALFRLGDGLCARLPLVAHWAEDIASELAWLPRLSPRLTLQIPEPFAEGEPTGFYPFPWAIYRWIEGEPYADGLIDDETAAAVTLARFVQEMRAIERVEDAPRGGRDPLRELDDDTRTAIDAASGVIDRDTVMAAWERSLEAPTWNGDPTWIHSDLLRPNLLVDRGRLCAVIDFGGVGVGDPATDVIPAWAVFGPAGREAFRAALDVDDETWARARGIALHQAAMIIPYYRETNPSFVTLAQRTIEQILADLRSRPRSTFER
jgi:aminoglycoside phosphotransferase (APT) family kinase protein